MGEILELAPDDGSSSTIPEDEVLRARVTAVKVVEKPFTNDDGTKAKKVEFRFSIYNPNGAFDRRPIRGETPTTFNSHPDCRLRGWATALLGMELPVGYKLDLDDLVDHECRIVVGLREYEKDGQKKEWNFVRDVMPTKETMSVMSQADEEPF